MRALIVLTAALALVLFLTACGGSASVGDISNSQEQNQAQDEAQIQTAQEACTHCADRYAAASGDEESLSDCVTRLGFDVSDC